MYQSALPVSGVGGAGCHVGASEEQLLCLHQRLQVLFEELCQETLAGVEGIALQRTAIFIGTKALQTLKVVVLTYYKTCSQARVHSFSISPCTVHSGSVAAFSSAASASVCVLLY